MSIIKINPLSKEQLSQQAKSTRDTAISENITVFDCEWQVLNDAADIRKVIQDAEITNASEDDSVMFRLADNSWRETTLSELKQVLAAQVERKRAIWVKFGLWDAGDKSEPFEV